MAKLTLMRKMWFNPALFVPLRNENGLLKSFSICKTILRPIIFLTPMCYDITNNAIET